MTYFDTTRYSLQNSGDSWSFQQITQGADAIFRFEVRPGDNWRDADGTKERSEVSSGEKLDFHQTYTMTYGFMVEPGALNTQDNVKIGQFHGTPDAADSNNLGPVFAIQLNGERMRVVTRADGAAVTPDRVADNFIYTDQSDLVRGHWYDMKIEIRFDPAGDGLINVWRDGVLLVHYTGAVGYNDAVGPYWKEGIYRAAGNETLAVDFKNFSLVASGDTHVADVGTSTPVVSTPAASSSQIFTDGGAAADRISGDERIDVVRGMDGDDSISGQGGDDDLNGNVGNDTVNGGDGADYVRGGKGDDLVYGGSGSDLHVNGNMGNDTVYGGAGADSVYGGQDNDILFGDDGADMLSGDLGQDTMTGGGGADRFVFRAGSGADVITDFNSGGGDRIQLSTGAFYAVSSQGDDVVIDFGGGDHVTLVGVSQASLGDWLVYA